MSKVAPSFLTFALWFFLFGKGLWLLVVILLFPPPFPYELAILLVLFVFLVIAASAFRRRPFVVFVVTCANLAGNPAVTQQPGGVAHPLLWYAYYQVINVLVLAIALGLWRINVAQREH